MYLFFNEKNTFCCIITNLFKEVNRKISTFHNEFQLPQCCFKLIPLGQTPFPLSLITLTFVRQQINFPENFEI